MTTVFSNVVIFILNALLQGVDLPWFNLVTILQGLERYFRDPRFDCSAGSGTRQNLGTGCGIFRLFVGNSGNRHDPNKLSSGVMILFRCRWQKSPRDIIAYQLLTPCSNDSDAQSRQPLQGFTFSVILRGFFPQLICYMVLDMANCDSSSATVKVVVSF